MLLRIFTLIIFLASVAAHAQNSKTLLLQGHVKDSKSKLNLSNATLSIIKPLNQQLITTENGTYAVFLPLGTYQLALSMAGYQSDTVSVTLKKAMTFDIYLKPLNKVLDTVLVATQKRLDNLKRDLIGVQKLSINELKNFPVLFGEKDILKSIQLLPGIKNAGEGSSGFFVRGGSSDQNLILLDGTTVNNASHLLGFFSVFNSDIIKNLSIYKGSVPAEFGGRLSSVLDIKTQDEGLENFSVKGGIGLITSRLSVQGPIWKNRISLMLSARKAYPDKFLAYSNDPAIQNNQLNFTDYNAKMQIVINKKNELSISGYKGYDVFGLGNYFGIDYGNEVLSMQWTHSKNSNYYSKTSLAYTNYGYTVKVKNSNSDLLILSSIRNVTIKHENQYVKNDKNTFKYGIDVVVHEIKPSSIIATTNSGFNSFDLDVRRNFEGNLFFTNDWKMNAKTSINYGIRINSFSILGPGNYVSYDSFGNPVKYLSYKLYQISVPYITPEPRISANIELSKHKYLKLAYTRTAQNIHQVSNSTSNTPIDLFMSSNNNLKPETADQFSAGYFANISESLYDFSAEIYFKSLKNQLDFRNGSQLVANLQVEKQLVFGIGRAYGMELQFKKKTGRLTGWVAYTLAKSERKFAQINEGNWFNARQDRTHEVSIVGVYQFNKRWVFSSTWVYYTGCPVTFAVGRYSIAGQTVYYYTDRNGSRMPDYHRLDLSVTFQGKIKSKFESNWTFSIYNAYNRENAYSIDFTSDSANPNRTIAKQTTLFKLVPSIIYNFKF